MAKISTDAYFLCVGYTASKHDKVYLPETNISNITGRVQVLITVGDKHTYPSLLSIVVTNKAKRLACFIMKASVSPNQLALSACVKLWYTNTSEECLRSKSTISLLNPRMLWGWLAPKHCISTNNISNPRT